MFLFYLTPLNNFNCFLRYFEKTKKKKIVCDYNHLYLFVRYKNIEIIVDENK